MSDQIDRSAPARSANTTAPSRFASSGHGSVPMRKTAPSSRGSQVDLPARTIAATRSEYSEICLPNDANLLGNMLGGHVMHLVDVCGAIAAMRHARCAVVTASVDQMTFLHPVPVGSLLLLKSQVNRVFRTSMEVGVKVWVENLHTSELKHTSSAYLTFVAVSATGARVPLPQLHPETEEDQRRFAEAGERRAYRLARKESQRS
jgi:acyl-CoA hydrolase